MDCWVLKYGKFQLEIIEGRHYGFLSTRVKQFCLSRIREYLNMKEKVKILLLTANEVLRIVKDIDPDLCPQCGQGTLICIC